MAIKVVPNKRFPLLLSQGPTYRDSLNRLKRRYEFWPQWIRWEIAEQVYIEYSRHFGHDQSLEQIAQRGGFSPEEVDGFLASRKYPKARLVSLITRGTPSDLEEDMERAACACVCDKCGLEYIDHPLCPFYIDTLTNMPWLHRLCEGSLVKL